MSIAVLAQIPVRTFYLKDQKRYFTSPRVDGFIAYQVSAGVAVIGGDGLWAPEEARVLLEDFLGCYEEATCMCLSGKTGDTQSISPR